MKSYGFSRILLATDGSEEAEAAAAVAASFAQAWEASVRVVHVWSLEVHHRHGFWDVETRSEATKLISDAVTRLRSLGVEADGELSHADNSHVTAAIAQAAREFNADLVVVGSRGLSEWQSMLQHGVSHHVLCAVDCPVLIVRGRSGELFHPRRVLLAVAGGDDLGPGVHAATAVASRDESKVLVAHVAQAIVGAQGFSFVETDDEIAATLQKATALFAEGGLEVETMVAEPGPVARVVAEVAARWQADVIVIGSSRMSDLAGMLFGSVTYDLLRATDRPVLVAERVRA
jgi:nucleotide-binding universal stress UspA family protein